MTLLPRLVILITLAAIAFPSLAQKKKPPESPPALIASPLAVVAGVKSKVTFRGAPEGKSLGVWTNIPDAQPRPLMSSTAGNPRWEFELAAGTPPGVYAARVGTAGGVSGLGLLLIDDLPTVIKTPRNNTPAAAQSVTIPAAVEGAFDPLACDYYRIRVAAAQRVAFEVYAQRLGAKSDPVVRIIDSRGRELAAVDDTPGLGGDIRFSHTFAEAGDYLVEIRDAEFSGSADALYRLRLGDFPAVTTAFPAGGKSSARSGYTFESASGERIGPIEVLAPADGDRSQIAVRSADGKNSVLAWILGGKTDEIVATGHTSRKTARPITLPANVSGRFDSAKRAEKHFHQLRLTKGQHIIAQGVTRGINSRASLYLEMTSAEGERLTDSKPADADDGLLDFTAPADGAYFIVASELTGLAGPAVNYRIEVAEIRPGFALSVDTERLDVVPGGALKLKVKVARRDYDGEIALAFTCDAAGWPVKNATIAKSAKELDLEISVPKDAAPGAVLAMGIVGRATVGGAEVVERARTSAALRLMWPRMPVIPIELDGVIGVGVLSGSPSPSR